MIKRIIIVLVLIFILSSCSLDNGSNTAKNDIDKPFERQDFLMGTIITQKVYGQNAQKASEEIVKKLKEIENTMTVNAPGGEINKLNSLSGQSGIELSSDSIYVLKKAKSISLLSDGAFDITIGPLVKAWGVFTDNPRVPSQDEIERLLGLVDYNGITVNDEKSYAMLEKAGQMVDLGGIAKGYGGDQAAKILKEHGIASAYVNLGGNVVTLGKKIDNSSWRIGIQNPRGENGRYIGILSVENKAVVTSGDYERYFTKDSRRYHHILDPRTGYPSDSGLISATIVADSSIEADALSTAVFILGLERGMELVSTLEGVEAIFVTGDKKVYISEGLKNVFEFEDETREFEYVKKR